jgi:hypothetical protein
MNYSGSGVTYPLCRRMLGSNSGTVATLALAVRNALTRSHPKWIRCIFGSRFKPKIRLSKKIIHIFYNEHVKYDLFSIIWLNCKKLLSKKMSDPDLEDYSPDSTNTEAKF